MSKMFMYIILALAMAIGSYLPTLWGADLLGMQSVLGGMVGGIIGIIIYAKLRTAGYIE